nr:ferredoxin [Mycolicibacterium thermoresistibile]
MGATQCVLAAPSVLDRRENDGVVILLNENPPDAEAGNVDDATPLCPRWSFA